MYGIDIRCIFIYGSLLHSNTQFLRSLFYSVVSSVAVVAVLVVLALVVVVVVVVVVAVVVVVV